MIHCTPHGIFSWAFDLDGGGHRARVEFDWFGEQGALVIDNEDHTVAKDGLFSGHWTLRAARRDTVVYQAQKTSALLRSFEIHRVQRVAVLRAGSVLGRTMVLEGDDGRSRCRIAPVHPFTRRATIDGRWEDFRLVAFAFWLSALMWRRAATGAAS